MTRLRHTYLHYEIEPCIYSRSIAMERLIPFLNIVRDAPMDYIYRADIVSLVVECMIRAIEARTMDTGIDLKPIPADIPRNDLDRDYQTTRRLPPGSAVRQTGRQPRHDRRASSSRSTSTSVIAFERTPSA